MDLLLTIDNMDATARFYSQPSYVGGGFPVFSGSRRQRGGGIFGALAKMVLPVLKNVGSSVLRTAGREAVGLASDVAQSALSGQGLSGIRQTLQQQGLKRLRNVGQNALRTTVDEFRRRPSATRASSSPSAPLRKRQRRAPPPATATAAATRKPRSKRRQRRVGGSQRVANF